MPPGPVADAPQVLRDYALVADIWRSRWVTDTGAIVECREALALPARRDRAVVLRRLLAREGTARVEVLLHPRGGFGAEPVRAENSIVGRST